MFSKHVYFVSAKKEESHSFFFDRLPSCLPTQSSQRHLVATVNLSKSGAFERSICSLNVLVEDDVFVIFLSRFFFLLRLRSHLQNPQSSRQTTDSTDSARRTYSIKMDGTELVSTRII